MIKDITAEFLCANKRKTKYSILTQNYRDMTKLAGDKIYGGTIKYFNTKADCILATINKKEDVISNVCKIKIGNIEKSTLINRVNKETVIITTNQNFMGKIIIYHNTINDLKLRPGTILIRITSETSIQIIVDKYKITLYPNKWVKTETITLKFDIEIPKIPESLFQKHLYVPSLKGLKITKKNNINNDLIPIKEYEKNETYKETYETQEDYVIFGTIACLIIILLLIILRKTFKILKKCCVFKTKPKIEISEEENQAIQEKSSEWNEQEKHEMGETSKANDDDTKKNPYTTPRSALMERRKI